jgi:integrase
LIYTGARPVELVSIEAQHIDMPRSRVILKTAKQRGKVKHRAVPVPPDLIDALDLVHDLRSLQRSAPVTRLWPRTRQHVWNVVGRAVVAAGIPEGPHASPKGLRHGFAIACLEAKIDPFTVQRWLGHTYVTTTQVYAQLVGQDEDALAAAAWASLR